MSYLVAYITSFIAFLAIDYVGLSYLIKPVFERQIGALMLDSPRLLPAGLFYAFLIFVVMWFVAWPALDQGKSLLWVFGSAALLGAAAYGTYEFTSFAVMRDWTWGMVALDLTWGTLVTGAVATIGVAVTRSVNL